MKNSVIDSWKSAFRLVNFVAWYLIIIVGAFYLLPMIGLYLEDRYDALAKPAKLISIISFFAAIAWWQIKSQSAKIKDSVQNKSSSQALTF